MKIAILDLFGGSGGVGRCTREILRQLQAESVQALLCGQSHVVDSFALCQRETPSLRLANLERPKFGSRWFKLKVAAKYKSQTSLFADMMLRETMKEAFDGESDIPTPILVNYPQMVAPPSRRLAFCIFLHDLNWRFYPGNFPDPELTDRHCRGWVERAAKVITNSESTRDEVIECYQRASDTVVAAPLAPFQGRTAPDFDASRCLANLGLAAGHFFLFPGVWGMHKGHQTLTDAVEMSHGADPIVVTCGRPLDRISQSTKSVAALRGSLAARWDKLIERKKLVVLEGLSELEMQALRAGCRAYVLPSQYEGFGFPLVEAIYHHRPAIVSKIKAHKEILNRYPQYKLASPFPPDSSSALALELDQASSEPAPPPNDWQRDVEATWSWKNTVRKILPAVLSTAASRQ